MNQTGWHKKTGPFQFVLREAGKVARRARHNPLKDWLSKRDSAGKGISIATFNTGISLLTIASRLHLDKPEVRELSRTAGD
jgi:hypothetical protein